MKSLQLLTIGQIKSAANDSEIESVIQFSLEKLRTRNINAHFVKSYVSSMTTFLLAIRNEGFSPNSRQNVVKAIEIFRKINRSN
jgi:hypothetical protein